MILKIKVAKSSNQKSCNQTKLPLKVKHNLKGALNVIVVEDPILNGIVHGLEDSVTNMDRIAIRQLYVVVEENLRDSRCLNVFKISLQIGHLKMDNNMMGDINSLGSKDESTHLYNRMLMPLTQ